MVAPDRSTEVLSAGQLRPLIFRIVALPVMAMLVVCGLLVWQVGLLTAQNGWVTHTNAVIVAATQAQKLLLDQETGLRGFLLTGEAPVLQPYRDGQAQTDETLARVAVLVDDNKPQQARVTTLAELYAAWSARARAVVAVGPAVAAWKRPADDALRADLHARKADMDRMRALLREFLDEEDALLQQRMTRASATARAIAWGGVAGLLLLGVAMALLLRRWIARLEGTYARALAQQAESQAAERRAREAAEALAAEISAESRELEARFKQMRDDHQLALAQRAPEV